LRVPVAMKGTKRELSRNLAMLLLGVASVPR
jgi:hypothetical protein